MLNDVFKYLNCNSFSEKIRNADFTLTKEATLIQLLITYNKICDNEL